MQTVLHGIEKVAAYLQGKGYGSATIAREVAAAAQLLAGHPVRLVLDIGANKGRYAVEARRAFPEAEIHMFEPAAVNRALLSSEFASKRGFTIHPIALSSNPGQAMLHADVAGSGLGSLSKRNLAHVGIELAHSEQVEVRTLESVWQEQLGARPIDLAKMDVEGLELEVLKGFGRAIDQTRLVQFEFGGCNVDTRTYFRDFYEFFANHGFEVFRIAPFGVVRLQKYKECDEFFSTTNFLARKAV